MPYTTTTTTTTTKITITRTLTMTMAETKMKTITTTITVTLPITITGRAPIELLYMGCNIDHPREKLRPKYRKNVSLPKTTNAKT